MHSRLRDNPLLSGCLPFGKMIRIAAACAVLRAKPDDISGEEFALKIYQVCSALCLLPYSINGQCETKF